MKMPKLSKNTILVLALIVVGIVGYYIFASRGGTSAPLTQVESGLSDPIGQQIVVELNRLRALQNINADFFKDPAFASLRDYTQVVVPQPVGRGNPFAPVGF